jgi:hypothetical protein
VACLAVLAIAGAYSLPADLALLADGRALQMAPAAWLTSSASPVATRSGAALLSQRAGLAARAFGQRAAQPVLAAADIARASEALAPASPLERGALSVPALLVAVTLAICH